MNIKKELPRITNKQISIIRFWADRGYSELRHALGYSVTLHRKNESGYGLYLQYLEQFHKEAQSDVIKMLDNILAEQDKINGKPVAEQINELKDSIMGQI